MASPGNTMRTQSAKADHERYQLRQPTAAAAEPARVTGPTAALQPQRGTRQGPILGCGLQYIHLWFKGHLAADMGDSVEFAAVRGLTPCHAWTKHSVLYPLTSAIAPIVIGAFPVEILKLAFDNLTVGRLAAFGKTASELASEAALALLFMCLSATCLVASSKRNPIGSRLLQPRKKRQAVSSKALLCMPANGDVGPAAHLPPQGPAAHAELALEAVKRNLEGEDAVILQSRLREPAVRLRAGWCAASALRCRANGGGRGHGRAAITAVSVSTPCIEVCNAHGSSGSGLQLQKHSGSGPQLKGNGWYGQLQNYNQNHRCHLAAGTTGSGDAQATRSALRPYVHRAELSSTRVKIHGVQPELIAAGYQERIAAVVTAAGQQLEGVYVRRGCIELLVDTVHFIEYDGRVLPAAHVEMSSPPAKAPRRSVGHLNVDELVQSLQLPLEPLSSPRRHSAVVWEYLRPAAAEASVPLGSGEHGASDIDGSSHTAGLRQRQIALATTARGDRPGDLAFCPELAVWPRVVCTAPGPRGMATTAVVGPARRPPLTAAEACTLRCDVAASSAYTVAPCAANVADGITASAALHSDAATAAEPAPDPHRTAALAVRIWWPLPLGSRKDDEPPEVVVSARIGGASLPVIWELGSCQILGVAAPAAAAAAGAMTHILDGDFVAAAAPSTAVAVLPSPPGGYDGRNVASRLAGATLQSIRGHDNAGGCVGSRGGGVEESVVGIGSNDPSSGASDGNVDCAGDGERAAAAQGTGGECGSSGATLPVCAAGGFLITGTCRIQDLPPGPGLLLLQAHLPEEEEEEEEEEGGPGCFTRPVPVLCVDDPLVAAEIFHACSGAVGDGDGSGTAAATAGVDDEQAAGEVEEFVVDLGFFLGGMARSAAAAAAAAAAPGTGAGGGGDLTALEGLGRHLYDSLSQTPDGDLLWPATRARLRRELDTIASWLRNQPPEDQMPVVASHSADFEPAGIKPCAEDLKLYGSDLENRNYDYEGHHGSGRGDASDGKNVSRSPGGSGDRDPGGCGGDGNGAVRGQERKLLGWVVVSHGSAAVVSSAAVAPAAGAGRVDTSSSRATSAACPVPTRLGPSAAAAAVAVDAVEEATPAGCAGGEAGTVMRRRRQWRQGQRWCESQAAVAATGAWACVNDMYGTLKDPGYQDFLTEYCAMQAPVLDVMFFLSVGGIVLRTWQEEPRWRQRPLPAFLSHVAPCLVTLATSALSTLTRPLLRRPAWSRLVRHCMIPRYLSFCLGLALVAAGWPPPPAIVAYHQRCASVVMGEGVVLSATVVIMPWPSLLLAALRVPAHVGVWVRVGAYKTAMDAVLPAVLLACCSIVTNLLLHAVLVVQYRRRVRARSQGHMWRALVLVMMLVLVVGRVIGSLGQSRRTRWDNQLLLCEPDDD
ncbi:hypothetical protein VOLCADRAFT_108081, partial [Volvox carteri f. nagariensis]